MTNRRAALIAVIFGGLIVCGMEARSVKRADDAGFKEGDEGKVIVDYLAALSDKFGYRFSMAGKSQNTLSIFVAPMINIELPFGDEKSEEELEQRLLYIFTTGDEGNGHTVSRLMERQSTLAGPNIYTGRGDTKYLFRDAAFLNDEDFKEPNYSSILKKAEGNEGGAALDLVYGRILSSAGKALLEFDGTRDKRVFIRRENNSSKRWLVYVDAKNLDYEWFEIGGGEILEHKEFKGNQSALKLFDQMLQHYNAKPPQPERAPEINKGAERAKSVLDKTF